MMKKTMSRSSTTMSNRIWNVFNSCLRLKASSSGLTGNIAWSKPQSALDQLFLKFWKVSNKLMKSTLRHKLSKWWNHFWNKLSQTKYKRSISWKSQTSSLIKRKNVEILRKRDWISSSLGLVMTLLLKVIQPQTILQKWALTSMWMKIIFVDEKHALLLELGVDQI